MRANADVDDAKMGTKSTKADVERYKVVKVEGYSERGCTTGQRMRGEVGRRRGEKRKKKRNQSETTPMIRNSCPVVSVCSSTWHETILFAGRGKGSAQDSKERRTRRRTAWPARVPLKA